MNSSIPKAKQKQYADYVKQITPTQHSRTKQTSNRRLCKSFAIFPWYGKALLTRAMK